MPYLPEIDARLAVLGFDRRGRYWQLQGSNVLLQAPGSALSPGERRRMPHSEADDSFQLSVRKTCSSTCLHEFVATGHADAFRQAVYLARGPRARSQTP